MNSLAEDLQQFSARRCDPSWKIASNLSEISSLMTEAFFVETKNHRKMNKGFLSLNVEKIL